MTLEEKILRNDWKSYYTEYDIKHYLKLGIIIYENYEDFLEQWLEGLNDEEEAPAAWDRLDRSEVDGKEYRYDVVL